MADKGRQESIRELLWEWDPLGDDDPTDPHLPRDEYDWLVHDVEQELDEGADAGRLASDMTNAVRRRYGLNDPPPSDAFASRIISL
jgi:hypothetical protein